MKDVLVIVPCGQSKIWDTAPAQGPVPAREAYTGAPFKVNRTYAEWFAEHWVILSAKYGLILPNFIIPGPYNVTFKRPSTHPVSIPTLRDQIHVQRLHRYPILIGLGGLDYRAILAQAFEPWTLDVHFPFAGLRLGEAMRAAKQAIASNALGIE